MRHWEGKRYWLIGASEGLGRALADVMSRAGVQLVLSARNSDRLAALAAELPGRVDVVPMDVTDQASVDAAAEQVGTVDGIVYLAGVYWPISARNWNTQQAVAMTEANLTGAYRALGVVLPGFVARDSGHVVLVGSLSGFRGLPGAIGYAPSKAGLMSLAECLYADLRNTGIEVQVANPGFVRTRLTEKNDFKMPFLMEPEVAAQAVFEHMTTDSFKRSFPAVFASLFRGGQMLPDWAWYRIFGGHRS